MATRIFVRSKTEEMPGPLLEKIPLMPNIVCQKVWKRDFNKNPPYYDRLDSLGGYINTRCFIIIDNGPVDTKEYTILSFHWRGDQLLDEPGPLHPYIRNQFETRYQFNPADRPKSITYKIEDLKQRLSPDEFEEYMRTREEQLARAKAKYGNF